MLRHCVHILAGHNGFVLSLCTVGDVLFTGSQDCNIMIWDLNNLQYIGTLPGHRGFVKCMVATLGRKLLCSGSQDKTIKIWSLETFSSTKTLYGHTSEVNSLTLMDGGDTLISAGEGIQPPPSSQEGTGTEN
ncbi:Myosin heavy chain kinase B [Symbiodinium microadriaticum]|uniref:Myosin heavy chain kinase B n=1 Tax=Symbiodinium microadriaticum TaxID=2951 RepID=A0A1Q9E0J2_SYMMI|nr:Myosin heavy chain kinase B [Symbiodinium microadriaticum]